MIVQKTLMPRDRANFKQALAIEYVKELMGLLGEDHLSSRSLLSVRSVMMRRVKILIQSNGAEEMDSCQLYDMLVVKTVQTKKKYRYFDTEGDSTYEFLERLARDHAPLALVENLRNKYHLLFKK